MRVKMLLYARLSECFGCQMDLCVFNGFLCVCERERMHDYCLWAFFLSNLNAPSGKLTGGNCVILRAAAKWPINAVLCAFPMSETGTNSWQWRVKLSGRMNAGSYFSLFGGQSHGGGNKTLKSIVNLRGRTTFLPRDATLWSTKLLKLSGGALLSVS